MFNNSEVLSRLLNIVLGEKRAFGRMKLNARQIVQVIDRENLRNKIDNWLANGEENSKDEDGEDQLCYKYEISYLLL